MPSRTVLIADPEIAAARAIEEELKKRFDVEVMVVQQSQLAIALFRSRKPWVCLASSAQNQLDGFKLCAAVRHLTGGDRCVTMVYGDSGDDGDARTLATECRLDSWLPTADPRKVAKLLEHHLSPRVPARAAGQLLVQTSPRHELFSARTPGTEDEPWEAPGQAPLEDRNWRELLGSAVSVSTLRRVLTKNIRLRKKKADPKKDD